MSEKQAKAYHRLWRSELITAFICGYFFVLISQGHGVNLDFRLGVPGALLIFILLQGALYWFIREQESKKQKQYSRKVFKGFKEANKGLFILYPVFQGVLLYVSTAQFLTLMNAVGVLVYFFAIAEYVNYYYFSLNYRQFKKPSDLALELKEGEINENHH